MKYLIYFSQCSIPYCSQREKYMKEYSFVGRNISLGRVTFLLGLFLLLFPLFSCGSSKKVNVPEFRVLEIKLAKGIGDAGDKDVLLNPTDSFTSTDPAVVAHVSFANLSGKHDVKWKWYSPDGKLYYATKNFQIITPQGKICTRRIHMAQNIHQRRQGPSIYPATWEVGVL